MTFPEAKFKYELRMNPNFSSFIVFGRMIHGMKMPKFYVGKWFLKCVNKSDYDPADTEELIKHFCSLTNSSKPLVAPLT